MQTMCNFGCIGGLKTNQNLFPNQQATTYCQIMGHSSYPALNMQFNNHPPLMNCRNGMNFQYINPQPFPTSILKNKKAKLNRPANKTDTPKKIKSPRKKFSPEEDEELKKLVEKMGSKKWEQIAKEMPGRTGRQCRDRYQNYLIPGFFNGQWSKEEDDLLMIKYHEFGSQWSKMAQFFNQRSANALKNRWNYFVSRHMNDNIIHQPIETVIYMNNVNNYSINNNGYNKEKDEHKEDVNDENNEEVFDNIINFTSSLAFIDLEPMNGNDEFVCKDEFSEYPYISNEVLLNE